ncbi:MarR family winged helix-turn-helix transcriptional regulator [Paenibacillus taiwanensis]|uniref:MarR family winged helix-turn-helix transcriptional regulator n=1 Tax=Paenibacillus taiwanensis TaxID=401638 RepID=UPI0004215DE1|nr:MarR family transcriptional regulator [Paenibacillus taiwanensis]
MPNKKELHQLQMNFRTMVRGMYKVWNEQMDHGINPTQFSVLEQLDRHESMKVTDLAKSLRLTPGAVTGITDKLIELQLVTRRRDELDRRTVYVELTEDGRKTITETIVHRGEMFERFFQNVQDEQLHAFLGVCKQVIHNLEDITKEEDGK